MLDVIEDVRNGFKIKLTNKFEEELNTFNIYDPDNATNDDGVVVVYY